MVSREELDTFRSNNHEAVSVIMSAWMFKKIELDASIQHIPTIHKNTNDYKNNPRKSISISR